MKYLNIIVCLALSLTLTTADAKGGPVHVREYERSDGTVVRAHTRSSPEGRGYDYPWGYIPSGQQGNSPSSPGAYDPITGNLTPSAPPAVAVMRSIYPCAPNCDDRSALSFTYEQFRQLYDRESVQYMITRGRLREPTIRDEERSFNIGRWSAAEYRQSCDNWDIYLRKAGYTGPKKEC